MMHVGTSFEGSINQHTIPMPIVCLSVGVQLECPDYKGSYLGELFMNNVSKVRIHMDDGV